MGMQIQGKKYTPGGKVNMLTAMAHSIQRSLGTTGMRLYLRECLEKLVAGNIPPAPPKKIRWDAEATPDDIRWSFEVGDEITDLATQAVARGLMRSVTPSEMILLMAVAGGYFSFVATEKPVEVIKKEPEQKPAPVPKAPDTAPESVVMDGYDDPAPEPAPIFSEPTPEPTPEPEDEVDTTSPEYQRTMDILKSLGI